MKFSLEQKREKVLAVLRAKAKDGLHTSSFYPVATFDERIVVTKDDQLWSVPYTIDDKGIVTLGVEKKAEIAYPVQESISPYPVLEQRAFDGLVVGPIAAQEGEQADGARWHCVIIEAGVSKNRRNYREQVLSSAASKYEGASVFYNHVPAGSQRDVRELIGDITGVSGALLESNGTKRYALTGIFTTFDQPLQAKLLEAYRLGKVHKFGFSHDVNGPSRIITLPPHGVVQDVTEIQAVTSVDLVSHAAAGGRVARIAEALGSEGDIRMFEHLVAWLKTNRPDLFRKLSATPTQEQVESLIQEALQTTPAPSDTTPAVAATAAGAAPLRESVTDPNACLLRELLIDRAFQGRTVPDSIRTTLREDLTLERRPTLSLHEAQQHIDRWVTAIAPTRDQVVGSGLGTIVETTLDAADKALNALHGFFQNKKVGDVTPFTSFREAYVTITGDKQITGEVRFAKGLRQFQRLFESRDDLQEAMTTASWGEILGDSIRRGMLAMYRQASIWDQWRAIVSDITSPTDFRTNRRLRLAGYGDLPTVPQNAPYNALTSPTDEEAAAYAVSKKGGTEKITIEMIANDDVGAIRRIPLSLAMAAKRTLAKSVFNLIRDNSVVGDGNALFHASHGNITANALSAAEITAVRVAMSEQTPYGTSDDVLDLFPKILLVPSELEQLGWRLTSIEVAPTTNQDATEPNYFRKRVGLDTLIVVPYWTDATDWACVADPAQIPTIEVGFYQGRQEPDIYIADNPLVGSMFTNDAIDYKIRFIWGVAVLEYRGFYGGRV